MSKALNTATDKTQKRGAVKLDWRKRMSDHVAYALLTYTGLHIFVTMVALKATHNSILPYLALVVLVLAIIPGCRQFEARWSGLSDEEAGDPALGSRFSRDRLAIWLCAIGLPFAVTGLYRLLGLLFT